MNTIMLPLSPVDTVMHKLDLALLYIFPSSTTTSFDLNKLRSSFVALVEQDYPFLIGEFCVDPTNGILNVKQTVESRQKGATAIKFETNPENPMTTEQAIEKRSWDMMPSTRGKHELICVKGTLFHDGGLAIGIHTSHSLFDGEAFFTFMKVWGQHYSGIKKEERLVVSHARHLLNGSGRTSKIKHLEYSIKDKCGALDEAQSLPAAADHFFYVSPKMMKGVKEAANSSELKNDKATEASYVSTVDALTALMTILISRARDQNQDVNTTTIVNARRHLNPPLPQNYVGNAIFSAVSTYSRPELEPRPEDQTLVSPTTLGMVARRVRSSILQCDNEYMQDAIDFLTEQRNLAAVGMSSNHFFGNDLLFTSWVHMDMYDSEFDGVRPSYACFPRFYVGNGMIVITEARKGYEGIEIGVVLECSAMERLKKMFAKVSQCYE
ncbi:Transferase [Plasmopara halstedii]|uniref:Transferase n=1 Tax=Plasmopara halstedii TaxID=4781 RepID=A0A0N7L661_PLAHL|nr:Transferase [Plasmopara halstedii]CEG43379.1 Transferase [Plasmopara halstedii]|eukprot:XP_024579748.1 Transferase [Plasmopara halstedii]